MPYLLSPEPFIQERTSVEMDVEARGGRRVLGERSTG